MKLSYIIPNYNGGKILDKNLSSVLAAAKNSKYNFEIIISDDKSEDNSVEIIKNFIIKNNLKTNDFILLLNSKNQGFATNVNNAVDNSNGDILILLNTDVIPRINFTNKLLKHFEDEKVFAVGCLDESIEENKIVERGRGKGKWEKGILVHSAAEIRNGDTLWVAGGSGAFRKSIWTELGGLDTIYNPFYWEDIDLSYRARKSGYKTIFEKESIVRHEHEKGSIKTKYSPNDIKKIAYRNQFIFAWKNSDISTLISFIFWLPYHLTKAVFAANYALILGFIKALFKLPTIIKSRSITRKLFKLKDKEVVLIN